MLCSSSYSSKYGPIRLSGESGSLRFLFEVEVGNFVLLTLLRLSGRRMKAAEAAAMCVRLFDGVT